MRSGGTTAPAGRWETRGSWSVCRSLSAGFSSPGKAVGQEISETRIVSPDFGVPQTWDADPVKPRSSHPAGQWRAARSRSEARSGRWLCRTGGCFARRHRTAAGRHARTSLCSSYVAGHGPPQVVGCSCRHLDDPAGNFEDVLRRTLTLKQEEGIIRKEGKVKGTKVRFS